MPRTLPALLIILLAVSVVPAAARADTAVEPGQTVADETSPGLDEASPGPDEAVDEAAAKKPGDFLAYEEPATHPRRSFASLMLRLLLSMAVILGAIYGGLMLVRLLARKAKVAPKSEKLIRIVDRAALDPKRAIYLVKVCDRLLVVGVGTSEIRTLAQIEDETVVQNVHETEFTGHLQSLLGRFAGRQN